MTSPQSVRCPKHGYYYQPDRAHGCVKCLEGPANEPMAAGAPSSSRFSPITGLIWLLVLGGLGWGGYQFFRSMGEKGGESFAELVEVEGRLNPAPMRVPLQRLENLIYAEEIDPHSQGSHIQRATMVLYSAVTLKTSQLRAAHHGNAIIGFGNAAAASGGVGYATINMDNVRREWEAVRAKVFHEAAWFKTAGR